ncbi:MAG: hypothetical protein K6C12_04515 [Oscillospiraceae bacterium]|nr:hypothetical protein [Oscillospiraceae bacterium]
MKKILTWLLVLTLLLCQPAGQAFCEGGLREPELRDDGLPEELLEFADHRGYVQYITYQTKDYVSYDPTPIDKDLLVYLPYGYDVSEKYNVLILLHCAGADHRFWLQQPREYRTEEGILPVSVPNLLDRMIEEGYCEPLIVVSPCLYLFDGHPNMYGNDYDYAHFAGEIGRDLLPFLAENYATWAYDGSRWALNEARDHFGFLGASFGAYMEYLAIIGDNFDLASWYTFCGGGEIDPGYLMNKWTGYGTQDFPLRLLLVSEGEYDDRMAPEQSVQNLHAYGGKFNEDNVKYMMIRGWGHEDRSYLTGLYNTLQLFFRENGQNPESGAE